MGTMAGSTEMRVVSNTLSWRWRANPLRLPGCCILSLVLDYFEVYLNPRLSSRILQSAYQPLPTPQRSYCAELDDQLMMENYSGRVRPKHFRKSGQRIDDARKFRRRKYRWQRTPSVLVKILSSGVMKTGRDRQHSSINAVRTAESWAESARIPPLPASESTKVDLTQTRTSRPSRTQAMENCLLSHQSPSMASTPPWSHRPNRLT